MSSLDQYGVNSQNIHCVVFPARLWTVDCAKSELLTQTLSTDLSRLFVVGVLNKYAQNRSVLVRTELRTTACVPLNVP